MLTMVVRYDLKFQEAIDQGQSPKEAFASVLKFQQEIFNNAYGPHEIEDVATTLQAELVAIKKDMRGWPIEASLSGSFLNGKANIATSDYDISINNVSLMTFKERWENAFNKFITGPDGQQAQMKIEFHNEPAAFYGSLSPFVLEIKPDGIKIIVFPPGRLVSDRPYIKGHDPITYDWR